MESEIISALKNLSVEIVVMALIIFAITFILKLPIKKFTSRFNENKRKALNTTILIIPALLSFCLSELFYGLFQNDWLSVLLFNTSLNVYILSLTIYAIFARVIILLKAVLSGKVKLNSTKTNETINLIKDDFQSLNRLLDDDNQKLSNIKCKIKELLTLKESIEKSNTKNSLIPLSDIVQNISNLKEEKTNLENEINQTNIQIDDLNN